MIYLLPYTYLTRCCITDILLLPCVSDDGAYSVDRADVSSGKAQGCTIEGPHAVRRETNGDVECVLHHALSRTQLVGGIQYLQSLGLHLAFLCSYRLYFSATLKPLNPTG
jgi:hypothetical protein